MKSGKLHVMIVSIIILLFLAACVSNESFKQGEDFAKDNRWEEAIAYFQKAVSEEPDNQEYKDVLQNAKREAAKVRLNKAKQSLPAAEGNLFLLEKLAKDGAAIAAMNPESADVKAFNASLKQKISSLNATLKNLYQQAEADIQKEDWVAALNKLNAVNKIFPNYEDTGNRLRKVQQDGARSLYQQGITLGKQEEWKMSAESFKAARDINPGYLDVSRQYDEAKKKDSLNYYLAEAVKAEKAAQWERALFLYEKAQDYPAVDGNVGKKIDDLKIKTGQINFDESIKYLKLGKLHNAVMKLEKALNVLPSLKTEFAYKDHATQLCDALMKRSEKLIEKELWGNALYWLQKTEKLIPGYPDLFQRMIEVKDSINKRIRKSIAVFDFGSPSSEKDAGKIAANKLIAYLHKNASGDLRIIERENLQSILREMQLSQTGLVDIKTAQSVGKMRGIDTFIMGDVLLFSAKRSDNKSINQVRVLVNEEDIRNPEFSDWLLLNPRPSENELKNAPPRMIKKKNYQLLSYNTGVAKISSLLEISFKLVDTNTGENIFANTVSGRLIKEDKYQDGLPIANITQDPLELPTEIEVLDEITNEKVSEMGRDVLKHFQSLEVEYFNQAQAQQKRRNYDMAVEKYTDAMYDEKLKGISTPISQKSSETIEKLMENK
ncbi:MAG TPA: CsgG/HfaB family protein [Smithellaceae bacterium]|nr:CsgG/HfaB family protein [Smithellaceae bacterium]